MRAILPAPRARIQCAPYGTAKEKAPDNCLSRTQKLPRCHLASRFDPCPLRSACTLPGLDGALPSRDTRCLSRAPSAVHLMHCFPPGSQPPGLSVGSCRTVISASTVFIWLCLLYHTGRTFVNRENAFLYTHPIGSQKGRERCSLPRLSKEAPSQNSRRGGAATRPPKNAVFRIF